VKQSETSETVVLQPYDWLSNSTYHSIFDILYMQNVIWINFL